MPAEEYTIQGGREGKRRLDLLGRFPHTLRLMEPHIIGREVLGPEDWKTLVDDLAGHVSNPDVVVGCPRIVQTSGQTRLRPEK